MDLNWAVDVLSFTNSHKKSLEPLCNVYNVHVITSAKSGYRRVLERHFWEVEYIN